MATNAWDKAVVLAEHLKRRKELYEARGPETKAGVAGGRGREKIASEIISFAIDTATKTGVRSCMKQEGRRRSTTVANS